MTDMTENLFSRLVVKVSGESLGIGDPSTVWDVCKPLVDVHQRGVGLAIVVGGGNLLRGDQSSMWGIPRRRLDVAGMLATAFNACVLSEILEASGVPSRVFSRGAATGYGTPYESVEVSQCLDEGTVVVLAGGMGRPGISTDVAAVHLAAETHADALVMSKFGVDGVYDADPRLNPAAELLTELDAQDALRHRLAILDTEALELAIDGGVTIRVIPAACPNALIDLVDGRQLGSTIHPR